RKAKSSIPPPKRILYKHIASSNDSLGEENASKQGMKSDKTKPMFDDSDFDELDVDGQNDNGSVGGVVVLLVGGFEVVMVVGGGEGWCYSGGVGRGGESGGWINL
ncbi:hypothetical protein Tco_1095790, partial [Tanacetum coccineum]